jgi:hypothetical protein
MRIGVGFPDRGDSDWLQSDPIVCYYGITPTIVSLLICIRVIGFWRMFDMGCCCIKDCIGRAGVRGMRMIYLYEDHPWVPTYLGIAFDWTGQRRCSRFRCSACHFCLFVCCGGALGGPLVFDFTKRAWLAG